MQNDSRSRRWQELTRQLADDYALLDAAEKRWIATRLALMAQLQERLDQLFRRGNGVAACCRCAGGCCARGLHHVTLANLLGYLQHGETIPRPDFSQTCPFLAATGCLLPVDRRPYNCISFVCDTIEDSLDPMEQAAFYATEKKLRQLYLEFSTRYSGGSLTGVLLQDERLSGRSLLSRKSHHKAQRSL